MAKSWTRLSDYAHTHTHTHTQAHTHTQYQPDQPDLWRGWRVRSAIWVFSHNHMTKPHEKMYGHQELGERPWWAILHTCCHSLFLREVKCWLHACCKITAAPAHLPWTLPCGPFLLLTVGCIFHCNKLWCSKSWLRLVMRVFLASHWTQGCFRGTFDMHPHKSIFVWLLFSFFKSNFLYFQLSWVFIATSQLFSICGEWRLLWLWCTGFLLQWLLLLCSISSRVRGLSSCTSQALEHTLSSSTWA